MVGLGQTKIVKIKREKVITLRKTHQYFKNM